MNRRNFFRSLFASAVCATATRFLGEVAAPEVVGVPEYRFESMSFDISLPKELRGWLYKEHPSDGRPCVVDLENSTIKENMVGRNVYIKLRDGRLTRQCVACRNQWRKDRAFKAAIKRAIKVLEDEPLADELRARLKRGAPPVRFQEVG